MSKQVALFASFAGLLLFASLAYVRLAPGNPPAHAHVPDEVLLKFKASASSIEKDQIRAELGGPQVRGFGRIKAELRKLQGLSVEEAIARYRNHPKVEYIEPNYIFTIDEIPDDTSFDQLWGLHNVGQTGGTPGADISAVNAWDVFTGSPDVLIGVIDTGVDYLHPDLAANIYENPGEIPGNGVDDDGNGFIDDVRGWDFVNNDNDPMDDNSHGSHVAGTIGAVGNNSLGVVGVNWNVKILPIKFLSGGGSGTTADAIASVEYATLMGVHLTNNSWGGGGFSLGLRDAIADAGANGILFVAAAGNSGLDTDSFPHYPSSYDLDNIVSVAATDHRDLKAGFSNYGVVSVDLAAPGVNILSSVPGGGYGTKDGTSMATPHVAGALGLVFGRLPAIGHLDAKNLVLTTADPLPNLTGVVLTGARLNAFMAIAEPDSIPPGAITDLAVGAAGSNWLTATWTAPGDDGAEGTASRYIVKVSTSPIDEAGFDAAMTAADPPDPDSSGSAQNMQVGGLDFNTTYYLAAKAVDEFGNASAISNLVSGTTLGAPQAAVDPASLSETLVTGSSATQNLTLSNVGEGTLDFAIPLPSLITTAPAQAEFLEVAKGAADPRSGSPVVEGAGGPDGYGYHWADSDEPGGPTFSWVDISATGATAITSADDTNVGPFPLGFDFSFYGAEYSSVRICSNGFLSFTSTSAAYTNQPIPNLSAPLNLVAPFWDDFVVSGGAVYYQAEADRFIVQWDNVTHYSAGGSYTFQAILYPDGRIEYQYLSMGVFNASGTIGIQNAVGTDALQVAFNAPYVHDNLAIRIQSTPQWVTVSPTEGTVFASGSTNLTVNFNPAGLLGGTYNADIRILSNDPDDPHLVVPVTLTVIGAPDLALDPPAYDFGPVFLGATPSTVIRVENPGTDSLHVSDVTISDALYSVDATSFVVPPRGWHPMVVTFSPLSPGLYPATLTLTSDDPDTPSLDMALDGEGIEPPDITVTPTSLSEDLFTGGMSVQSLTLGNAGVHPLDFSVQVAPVLPAGAVSTAFAGLAPGDPGASGNPPGQGLAAPQTSGWTGAEGDFESLPACPLPLTCIVEDRNAGVLYGQANNGTLFYRYLVAAGSWEQLSSCPVSSGNNGGATLLDGKIYTTYTGNATMGVYDIATDSWTTRSNPVAGTANIGTDGTYLYLVVGSTFRRFDPVTGTIVPLAPPPFFFQPWGALRHLDGSLYGHQGNGGAAFGRYDIDTNTWTQLASLPTGAVLGAAVDPVARRYYAYGNYFADNLFSYSIEEGTWEAYTIPFFAVNDGGMGWFASPPGVYFVEGESGTGFARYVTAPPFLTVEPTGGTVASGESLDLSAAFDATGLIGGDYFANVLIASNDPDEPEVSVPAALHVTGAPDIQLSATSLDFGTPFIGGHVDLPLTVVNVGTDELVVSSLAADDPAYTTDVSSFSLPVASSQVVTVRFTPTATGTTPGILTVDSNDPDSPSLQVSLTGSALEPPEITVSPTSLSEALLTNQMSTQVVGIGNTGVSDLEFQISIQEPDGGGMTPAEAVGSAVSRSGILQGSLQGTYTDLITGETVDRVVTEPDEVADLAYGPASGFDVAVVAPEYAAEFGDVQAKLLGTGHFASVALINAGMVTPTLPELQAFDAVLVYSRLPYLDQVTLGDNLADYVDSGGGVVCSMFEVAVSAGFPQHVLRGRWDTEEYYVVERSDHVSGHATLGTVHAPAHPTMDGVASFDGGSTSWKPATSTLTSGGTLIAEWSLGNPLVAVKTVAGTRRVDLGFYPPSADVLFGSWDPTTDGDLLLGNALAWVAGGVSWLSATPVSGVVPPGETVDVDVDFDATGLFGGTYDAEMLVASNDPDDAEILIPVSLQVTGVPDLALDPASLDFGTHFLGASSSLILSVSNIGTDGLEVTSVGTDQADYTVSDPDGFTLLPGEVREVTVTFTPFTVGPIPGTLTLLSNDPDTPSALVPLSGEGLEPPDITVSPSSLSEDLYTGEFSLQTLTVGNTGLSALDFSVQVIAEGSGEAVVSTFTGIDPGDAAASNNDPGSGLLPPLDTGYIGADGEFELLAPSPDRLTCVVEDRSAGYLYGQADRGTAFYRYDVSTDTWETLVTCPIPAGNNGGAALLDGKIYTSYTGNSSLGVYDIAADSWSILSNPLPGTANIGTDGTYLYQVVGNTFRRTNPVTMQVTTLAPPPFAFQSWGALRHLEGVIYGHQGNGGGGFASYDIATDSWTALPPLPSGAVLGAAIDPLNRTYYTYGSYGGTNLYAYSISEETWEVFTVPFFTLNDGGMGWFSSPSGIYFVQGELGTGFARFTTGPPFLTVEPILGTVPPGGSVDLTARFDATGLIGGDYLADVLVASNDPDEPEVTVPASLHVTGAPNIVLSTDALDFGSLFLGDHRDMDVDVRNTGTDDLIVSAITSDSPDYTADAAGFILPVGGIRTLTVQFAPSSVGPIPAVLSIESNDPGDPTVTVDLSGTGVVPPVATLTPDQITASLLTNEMETRQATLGNDGGSDLAYDVDVVLISEPGAPRPPAAPGPKVALHTRSHALKSAFICMSEGSGGNSPTLTPCSEYVVRGPTGSGQDVYLVAASDQSDIAGMSCGIEYGPNLDVYEWYYCGDGLAFPSDEWPASGSGARLTWSTCQGSTLPPDGAHAIGGAFYVYAYGPETFRVTPNNTLVGPPELAIVACSGGTIDIPETSVGEVGFSSGLTLPGYNPCSNSVSIYREPPPEEGVEDTREGEPVVDGFGGPDVFGYRWKDSDHPDGPEFDWIDISGLGTVIPISGDNVNSGFLPIGFTFPYYGQNFTRFAVCTNGWISFTSLEVQSSNQPLPASFAPGNLIAPFWDDLYFPSHAASYHSDGGRLVIQYEGVQRFGSGSYTFQIVLRPSGRILFQYLSMSGLTSSATVGFQNGTKDDGLTIAFNTPYLHDNLAIEISREPEWLMVDPRAGIVPAGSNSALDVVLDATGLYGGEYLAEIYFTTNDPVNRTLTLPVSLDVTGVPDLVTSTDELDYGQVLIGYPEVQTLLVTNTGTDLLSVSAVTAGLPAYAVDPDAFDLNPFESQEVQITLDPGSPGDYASILTLVSNDPQSPQTVALSATAHIPPTFTSSPDVVVGAALPGGTKTKTLSVCNPGGLDLTFEVVEENEPPPPPGDTPKVALHTRSHTVKSALICRRAEDGGASPTDIPCSDYVTEMETASGYDIYLTAVTPDSQGIAGLSCGIEYDNDDSEGVDIFGWFYCGTGLEFPSTSWPASGSGNRMTEVDCQETWLAPDGIHAVMGAFYVYAYSQDIFRVTEHRELVSGPELRYVNCLGEERDIPVTATGGASFSAGALVPGFNPCVGGVPVYSGTPPLAKGQEDLRVGIPVIEGSAGPDLFGYRWIDSDTPGGPEFDWVEIGDIGTPVSLTGDDQVSASLPIGFPFPFYGTSFTEFTVCTNGYLSFSPSPGGHLNHPLPAAFAPPNLLAPFWDDLVFGSNQAYYHQDGNRLIVQFDEVHRMAGDGPYTFQVILRSNGRILFQYLSMNGTVNSATVGIQNGARDDGLTMTFNQPYLHDNLAVRIAADPRWIYVTPTAGVVPPGQCVDLAVTLDADLLEAGDYFGDINFTSNDPARPLASTPVVFHVGSIAAAAFDADPNTLNLGSQGQWVNAFVELPAPHDPSAVLLETVRLNGTVPTIVDRAEIGDSDENGIADLNLKFDRTAVESILEEGDSVEVTVAGEIEDVIYFTGTEFIRSIRPQIQTPNGGEAFLAGSYVEVVWSNHPGWAVSSATVTYSPDGGSTWNLVADGITGESYLWQVPGEPTESGLLRVYVYDEAGILGHDTSDGVFAVNTVTGTAGFVPTVHALFQNAPNPFSASSRIVFDLPEGTNVRLRIYDVKGRMIRVLEDEWLPAGRHEAVWHGRDQGGRPVSAGVYFYRLEAGSFVASRRMLVAR